MDFEKVLISLVVLLIAARLAAEAAERLGQPAVLGEIIVGIAIGPSALGLVEPGSFLRMMGQLGAVLLLFEVGMQMNLGQMGKVGGDSLRVAAIGMAVPMGLGFLGMRALGVPADVSVFVSAGITATSVGITARVFADLRALATSEARTVLGAAVADDVGGLLVLTVVTALSSGNGVNAAQLATLVAGALGFVLVAGAASAWAAPAVFRQLANRSRTEGTLLALALAFALAVSLAASAVHLAPIVGAFIAGLAVSRTEAREELHRRMSPLSQFFVPIFFLLIGIETKLGVFLQPSVMGLAAVLGLAAVAGKIASGIGVRRGRAQRLLVGVAMIPRGEVGLIFAGIGLASGVLDSRYYGILVAVVLISTLVTPPAMRRVIHSHRRRTVATSTLAPEPEGGWLKVTPDEVELNAEPPDVLAGKLGFEAAVMCASRRPGAWLLQWLSSAENHEAEWDDHLRRTFYRLLQQGNVRSWRFLEVTGLLDQWMPLLGAAARERKRDPFNLDPGGDLRWDLLEDLHSLVESAREARTQNDGGHGPGPRQTSQDARFSGVWRRLENADIVLLAALARSAFGRSANASEQVGELGRGMGLSKEDLSLLVFLVEEQSLLTAAATRFDMGTEDSVLELAAHIGDPRRADALYVLAVAENAMEPWERERLDELFDLLQSALEEAGRSGEAADPVRLKMSRTADSLSHLPKDLVMKHLENAPRKYLIAQGPEVISRHIDMTSTPLAKYEVRLEAEPAGKAEEWTVHLALQDRRGLLASIAGAFAAEGISIKEAFVSTWRNGNAIDVFKVRAPAQTDWELVRHSVAARLPHAGSDGQEPGPIEGIVNIDNLASPWHTILEVRAYDRTGLLYKVASALAKAGLHIHMAVVSTDGDVAVDIFYVSGPDGGKLDESGERKLRRALEGKPHRGWQEVFRQKTS